MNEHSYKAMEQEQAQHEANVLLTTAEAYKSYCYGIAALVVSAACVVAAFRF